MTGVDILKVAEKHAPEVVYLALKDALEENQRLADTLREIAHGEWLLARAPEEVARVRGLARAALESTTKEESCS